jgi:predicted Zn finger-like uncharacterized protein
MYSGAKGIMIVNCPECYTRFSVPEKLLGPSGRTLKCAKCGHKWLQRSLPLLDEVPLEMDPAGFFREEHTEQGNGDESPYASIPDDIGMEDSRAFNSSARASDTNDRDEEAARLLDDDMDSIPDSFRSGDADDEDDDESKKKFSFKRFFILLFIALSLLGGAGGGAYVFREHIVTMWPQAIEYYAMFGVTADPLGAGLKFRQVTSERLIENDTELLVVRGVVANVSDIPRDVPLLSLALFDGNDSIIQEKKVVPLEKTLAPGATIGFRLHIESPSASAKRFEVTFVRGEGKN